MRTTVVRPVDPILRAALRLALLFAACKLAFHVAESLWEAHIGWGYYSDEMYYILCGRHLAWSYVDHGPRSPCRRESPKCSLAIRSPDCAFSPPWAARPASRSPASLPGRSAAAALRRVWRCSASPPQQLLPLGDNGYTGESMIVLAGLSHERLVELVGPALAGRDTHAASLDRAALSRYFESVEVAGYITSPYSSAYEHQDIYLVASPKFDMAKAWPTVKSYF